MQKKTFELDYRPFFDLVTRRIPMNCAPYFFLFILISASSGLKADVIPSGRHCADLSHTERPSSGDGLQRKAAEQYAPLLTLSLLTTAAAVSSLALAGAVHQAAEKIKHPAVAHSLHRTARGFFRGSLMGCAAVLALDTCWMATVTAEKLKTPLDSKTEKE